jgi:rhomboid protease GluP
MPLPVRWRYKLDRWRREISGRFQSEPEAPRPRLCPACGTLVGATATKCHQCGASMTFSMAAASRSLSRLIPNAAPVTYVILGVTCLLYVVSFLATMRRSGFAPPGGGGLGMILGLGGISGVILDRLGASLPLAVNLEQPWRLVTAMFLHGSLLHIGFNMWILMDIGPMLEEKYGSARFFFIYITTGIAGFVVSSTVGNASVGASGALLGMVGVLLALTVGTRNASMRMMRSQLLSWLIYIAVLGFLMPAVDNYAHAGGFAAGFGLGRVLADRRPADLAERRLAEALGWAAGAVVAASFAFMLMNYFATARPML